MVSLVSHCRTTLVLPGHLMFEVSMPQQRINYPSGGCSCAGGADGRADAIPVRRIVFTLVSNASCYKPVQLYSDLPLIVRLLGKLTRYREYKAQITGVKRYLFSIPANHVRDTDIIEHLSVGLPDSSAASPHCAVNTAQLEELAWLAGSLWSPSPRAR